MRDFHHVVRVARETVLFVDASLPLRSVCSLKTRFAVVLLEERRLSKTATANCAVGKPVVVADFSASFFKFCACVLVNSSASGFDWGKKKTGRLSLARTYSLVEMNSGAWCVCVPFPPSPSFLLFLFSFKLL